MSDLLFQIKGGKYQITDTKKLSNEKQMYELTIQKSYFIENEVDMLKEVSKDLETTNNMVKKRIKRLGDNFEK